jgi:phosphoadenosine phosphosulfate reductase
MEATQEILKQIDEWNEQFNKKDPKEVLSYFLNKYKAKIALSSSLGAEDQVLTEMIVNIAPSTRIFTLDTGRLFPETYDLISNTNKKYNIQIEVLFPEYAEVEKMVNEKGINLFYDSVENRKLCCGIRKRHPIKRAFKDLDIWVCGLRKDQSLTRFFNKMIEWDEVNGLLKLNPLINWSEKDVWNYIKEHDIPYNELHDKGFPSIGCQPCTRAVEFGEDIRSGRWWWETPDKKECGLHSKS